MSAMERLVSGEKYRSFMVLNLTGRGDADKSPDGGPEIFPLTRRVLAVPWRQVC